LELSGFNQRYLRQVAGADDVASLREILTNVSLSPYFFQKLKTVFKKLYHFFKNCNLKKNNNDKNKIVSAFFSFFFLWETYTVDLWLRKIIALQNR